jgi:hypothetical protein
MIKKLRAKWALWFAGYCTTHFVPKKSGKGGRRYCQQCNDECIEKSKHRTANAISILKGKS